jgi:hypothetical protein
MLEHARLEKLGRIDRKKHNQALLVNPVYAFNLHQQKKSLSSWGYRPVVSTNLDYLHCDLGFFPKSRHFETPVTFRSGYLVIKDVSSRFVYLVPLRKNSKADSIVLSAAQGATDYGFAPADINSDNYGNFRI